MFPFSVPIAFPFPMPITNRVLWADADEVVRLKKLLAQSRRGMQGYIAELTTPKPRPKQPKR